MFHAWWVIGILICLLATSSATAMLLNEEAGNRGATTRLPSGQRGQQAASATQAAREGRWPAFDTARDPKGKAALLTELAKGTPEAFYAPGVGFNLTGLEESVLAYVADRGVHPQDAAELAPYCFSWPTVPGPTIGKLVLLAPGNSGPALGAPWALGSEEARSMSLSFAPQGVLATIPLMLPSATGQVAPVNRYAPKLLPYARIAPGEQRAAGSATVPDVSSIQDKAERNERLFAYLQKSVNPVDVRLRTARLALGRLIQQAARRSNKLPASLAEAQRASGATLVQMDAVTPVEADLIVEFDGRQGYRYKIRLSNGEWVHVVAAFFALHPMDAANIYVPDGRLDDTDRVWSPFAALRFQAPAAQLPPPVCALAGS